MRTTIVVKGRLTGPRTVELEEDVSQATADVEVLIRPVSSPPDQRLESIGDYVRRLPTGTRRKADIDRQIQEERDSWGDR